ncbi:hypothetical protein BDW22DRAFT_1346787 [Trametopsis cervina]|nr:hypothetical protein BDW22DRAFT_1346787 [Trametopsis cervina]
MNSSIQQKVNTASVRVLAALEVIGNVTEETRWTFWNQLSADTRIITELWNEHGDVLLNRLAASAALEVSLADQSKSWPKPEQISRTDPRLALFPMHLIDDQPMVPAEVLEASGEPWWEEFRQPPQAAPSDFAQSPTPPPRSTQSRTPKQTRSRKHGKTRASKKQRQWDRDQTDADSDDESLPASPLPGLGVEADSPADEEADNEDESEDEEDEDDHAPSRPAPRATRRRTRSQSKATAGANKTPPRPALKSAMKKTQKRVHVASPASSARGTSAAPTPKRRKVPRVAGHVKPLPAPAASAQQTDDEMLDSDDEEMMTLRELVNREVKKEDWHEEPVLSPIFCEHCKASRSAIRHRCLVYLNPEDKTSTTRCIRCVRLKTKCDLGPGFGKGGRTTAETVKILLFHLKVAEDRYAHGLELPETVEDAVSMFYGRHARQNEPAQPEDDGELTDGQATMEFWYTSRAKLAAKASSRARTPAAGKGRGRGRSTPAAKKSATPVVAATGHHRLRSPPAVYIKTRAASLSQKVTSRADKEDRSKQSHLAGRRGLRMRVREANDGGWQILTSVEELLDGNNDWERGVGYDSQEDEFGWLEGESGTPDNHLDMLPEREQSSELNVGTGTAASTDGSGAENPISAVPPTGGNSPGMLEEGVSSSRDRSPRPIEEVLNSADQEQQDVDISHTLPQSMAVTVLTLPRSTFEAGPSSPGSNPQLEEQPRLVPVPSALRTVINASVQTDSCEVAEASVQTQTVGFGHTMPSIGWGWAL